MIKYTYYLLWGESLDRYKTVQISDTIHGSVKLNYLEKQVISTQIFNRLHNIYQNSTVYLTFPTNRTKRFEHSIGTMWLCGKIFQESISNSDNCTLDKFFKSIESIIDNEFETENLKKYENKYRSKLGDRNLSKNYLREYKELDISQEYNSFIPRNVESKYKSIYVILFQAIRIGALLHDVGHPPFSHIAEFALNDVWKIINEVAESDRTERQKEYIECMQEYFSTNQDLHEQIGNKITEKVLDDIIENIAENEQRNKKVFQSQLFKVIVSEVTSAILQEKHKVFGEIHKIIDGTLDGDRLDYVSRDPINSGLNVGRIEYDRIITGIRLIKKDDSFIFSPSSKVIDSIEDFFERRWRMYRQIIHHHRVIKTDYLLESCIKELALDYLSDNLKEEECTNILPYNISGLWKAINYKASHQDFFDMLIQWDDGWLMTIMKKHYYSKYVNDSDTNTFYKLEELLANNKNYYSLIKRMEDFITIDRQVVKIMAKEYDNIDKIIKEIKEDSIDKDGNIVVEVNPLLKYISRVGEAIKKYDNESSYIPKEGFILAKIKIVYSNLFEEGWFDKLIYDSIDEITKSNDDIKDSIPVIKKVKTGIQGGKTCTQGGLGLYAIKDNKLEVMNFSDLSNKANNLAVDSNFIPLFYMYILKNKDNLDYENIKISLGNSIGNKIADRIKDRLQELK